MPMTKGRLITVEVIPMCSTQSSSNQYLTRVCLTVCGREYRCRFTNTDTMLFCMRVMVGVIILYDHVHPVGAFAKTSKIDVSS